MRRDIKPRYHPRSNPGLPGAGKTHNASPHNCIICRHPEKQEVERKYLDGWRLCDIQRTHPWILQNTSIREHCIITGLADEKDKIREIDLRRTLESIVRAGYPMLDQNKVYPRDVIEAVKALNELDKKGQVESIWDLIMLRKRQNVENTASIPTSEAEYTPGIPGRDSSRL